MIRSNRSRAAVVALGATLGARPGGLFLRRGQAGDRRRRRRQGAKATTMTVAMITHQAPGDTFWDIIRKGAEAAVGERQRQARVHQRPRCDEAGAAHPGRDRQEGRRHRGDEPQHRAPSAGRSRRLSQRASPSRCSTPGRPTSRASGAIGYFGQDEKPAGVAVGASGRQGRRQEHPLRHPGAGPAAARGPLRGRHPGCRWSEGRATVRQRSRRRRRHDLDPGQADTGQERRLGRHPRRTVRARRGEVRLRGRQLGQDRRRSTRTRSWSPRSRTARSPGRSTSSPTCRATWRSTRSGSTRPTAT